MGFSESKKLDNGEEAVLNVIMAQQFLELIKDLNPKNQEAHLSPEQNLKICICSVEGKKNQENSNNPTEGEKEKRKGRVRRKVQNKAIVININV